MIAVAVAALLVCLAGLVAAYSRMLPPATLVGSLAQSAACALAGAAPWLALAPLGALPAPERLHWPIAALGAIAGFLVSLAVRAAGAGVLRTLAFTAVWSALVFVPAAALGFAARPLGLGPYAPLDHGGALSLHIAAGAAVAGVLLIRAAGPTMPGAGSIASAIAAPIVIVLGWLGWLVAADLDLERLSMPIIVNGCVAGLGAVLGWLGVQRIRGRRPTSGGVTAGVLCGLVAVSAGAPLLTPVSAAASGVFAGALAAWLVLARVDRTGRILWFVAGSHVMAGAVGMLFLGLLANELGYIFTGQTEFILGQLGAALAVALWSGAIAAALAFALVPAVPVGLAAGDDG